MKRKKSFVILMILLFCSVYSFSQEANKAKEVLEKYVKATGGAAAHARIKNRTTNSIIQIKEGNQTLNLIIKEAKPARSYSRMSGITGGLIEKGCNGRVAWEKGPEGVRILSGLTKWSVIRNSAFDKYINWGNEFSKVSYLGSVTIDSRQMEKLVLLPVKLSGKDIVYDEVLYFDVETGLLARTETRIPSKSGTLNVLTVLEDYRTIDGIKLPYRATISAMGQEREIRVLKITHNTPMPNRIFSAPFK